MSEVTAWGEVFKINGQFLRAAACAGIAWASWQGVLVGFDLAWPPAVGFATGAIFHGTIATFKTGKAIAGTMRWGRFKQKGVEPKSDKLADPSDLRKAGLIK